MPEIPAEGNYLLYIDNGDKTITIYFRLEGEEATVVCEGDMLGILLQLIDDSQRMEELAAEFNLGEAVIIPDEVSDLA